MNKRVGPEIKTAKILIDYDPGTGFALGDQLLIRPDDTAFLEVEGEKLTAFTGLCKRDDAINAAKKEGCNDVMIVDGHKALDQAFRAVERLGTKEIANRISAWNIARGKV